MHILQGTLSSLDLNSLKFVPKGAIDNDNKSSLVLVIVWHQISDKPLSEPVLTQFTDTYIHH